ncbi:uncharacterized protein PgNI_07073, partial [Pyricularia grisea]|uniref:Uncharacterized protein n=1 Tax=Pyricularia grisea TaxID=148305 RepID=A0A6P8B1M4_PYRGI
GVPRSLTTDEAQFDPSCRLLKSSWHGRSQITSSLKSLLMQKQKKKKNFNLAKNSATKQPIKLYHDYQMQQGRLTNN